MVHASQNAMSESALIDLWYTRLPETVASAAMIITSSTLDRLRKVDTTYENWQLRNSCSVNAASSTSGKSESEFEKLVAQLTKWMADNKQGNQRSSRNRSQSRSRGAKDATQSQRRRDESIDQFDDCWYHRTFGRKATSCRKPCNFRSPRDQTPSNKHPPQQ